MDSVAGDLTATYDARGLVELDGAVPKVAQIDGDKAVILGIVVSVLRSV